MEERNTKEHILTSALSMFAQRSYKAVSIRDIAKDVGIKESSIYYHFKNKQAIMDELLCRVDELIEEKKTAFDDAFSLATEISEEAMCSVAASILENYLMHPFVYPIIKMLSIERLSDKNAYEVYKRIVFTLPLSEHKQVFRQMIERGYIKDNNTDVLAEEYYAVIYLAFQKHCIGCDIKEAPIKIAHDEIIENIVDLYRKMKGEKL